MSAYLSARMAADYCGVSEKTIRNWIAEGKVRAEKSAGTFRIDREQLDAPRRDPPRTPQSADRQANGSAEDIRAESAEGPHALTVDDVLRLVRDVQADAMAKAEAVAMWQARAELLSQMLDESRERIRMLEAPESHQTHEDANLTAHAPDPPPGSTRTPVTGPAAAHAERERTGAVVASGARLVLTSYSDGRIRSSTRSQSSRPASAWLQLRTSYCPRRLATSSYRLA